MPFKLLSVLLQYPTEQIVEVRDDIVETVAELPSSRAKRDIEQFCDYWAGASPIELAQRYVEAFDMGKRVSLYLSYYLHGDRRQRGMALVRLKKAYAAAGLVLENGELPDYLPVMLEFAEFAPHGYGETILREHRPAIEALRAALRQNSTSYAHLLDALCHGLPELTLPEKNRVKQIIGEGPPSELVGLESFAPADVMPDKGVRP